MQWLRKLSGDERGLAALEFAFIAPILSAMLVLGSDGWMMTSQAMDMRTAVHTGARYYQGGGTDDTVAQAAALAAWSHKPDGGALTVGRACYCAGSAISCSSVCASGGASSVVTLRATSTFSGAIQHRTLAEQDVIRVS